MTTHLLAANEAPYGPLPSVRTAIQAAIDTVNRYPDRTCTALVEKLAWQLGVSPAGVLLGCGSVGMLQTLLTAVAEPGGEVVYGWRSFEAYPTLTAHAGLTPVPVPLRDSVHDLDAMAAAITPRTRMVIVCNPNNPTGTAVRRAELTAFLDAVGPGPLIVLDEAYREYVRDEDVPDGLTLAADRRNVVVLRTFSKAYGLAGLRVGYAIADPAVAPRLRAAGLSFAVNAVAQAAAVASLEAEDELVERVEDTIKERHRLRTALLELGVVVPESEANCLWLPLGADADRLAAACAHAGVVVRSFPGEGVRVSVGLPEDSEAFLAAAAILHTSR